MRSKMLRLPIFLLFLVTTVFAATQNGWNEGKVYTYKIRSRTLAAVNPQSKQFAGILMKADLSVQPNSQNLLRAKISQPRYSRIHTKLENGWDMEIPKEKMKMMDLPLSDKPFEVKIQNGVIRDLVVDEEVPTWEVNMLKSIVSQLQVDTQGQNAKKSKQRQAPETRQPFASFRTMEDSVGGKCEVLYDISPVPEQTLQKKPELAPMLSLREDGEIISLVKTKNFSHCSQRVSYHLGINGRNTFEPGDNDNGRYLSRSSVSRIVISGNLKRYTIQSSVTNNKVILNPDQQDNQQGFVASKMNLTLIEVKDATEPLSAPAKPQSVGNLVYNYNSPFESASSRRPNRVNEDDSRTADESKSSFDSMQNNDGNNYLQSKPKLSEPPQNPMLPYFVGNGGNSIQNDEAFDAVKAAKDTARQIANDMRKPDEMVKEQTLEKYVILSRLIRTMSAHQIEEAYSDLYELPQSSNQVERDDSQNQNDRRNAWVAFRDATANAGTGPALINIKQWIQNRKIEDSEAAVVLNSFIKSVQIPTPEFLNAVFDLVKMQETKEQPMLRDTAVLSFTDLIRHTIVNKRSAHNRYPVHAFGRLFSKNNRDLHKKYIPYIMEELESAIKNGDSKKVEVYTVALGNTGHPRILSILEPYIEGRKPISPFQRLIMVMSLEKLTSTYPKHARSVLYKIYSNNGDHHEIRCAAVFMLMKTNPPASMLQRMAEATNHESNKHVNSAVKSSIESLAQLRSDDTHELSNAAKAALPLLTNKNFGIDSSRAILKEFENPQTRSGFSIEAKLIGSEDSIIPKGVSITINPVYNGLKVAKVHLEGVVSTIQNLWDFVEDKLKINEQNKNWNENKSNRYSDDNNDENDDKNNSWDRERNNRNSNENTKDDFNEDESRNPSQRSWNDSKSKQRTGERKYSPEYISRLLGIRGDDPQEIEGFIRINEQNLGNYFLPFDNHSLESLPQRLNKFDEIMKKGARGDYTKFSNYELTISFPTETGYPLTFTLKTPTLMSVNIKADSATRDKPDLRSPIPKSATVNGKLKLAYAVNIQKRIGFVTPFEHKEYLAGVDRNLNFYLPIHSEIKYDVDKKEAQLKLRAYDNREVKIAQLETRPFTSEHDALSLQPIFADENTHTIKNNRMSSSKVEYKDKNNNPRVQLQWETESDESTEGNEESMTKNPSFIGVEMKLARSLAAFTVTDDSEKTKYEKYSAKVSFDNDISAEMRVSYDTLSKNWNNDQVNSEALNAKAPDLDKSYDENKRKEHFLEEVTKNINSVRAKVVDMTVQMTGAMTSSAAFTAAISNSEVDEKSRGQLFASLRTMDGKDYHLGVGLEIKNPNVDSFDYEETLKANTGSEYDLDIHFGNGRNDGENKGEEHRMRVRGNTKPSEERKNEIRQSRDAQMCTKDKNQSKNKMTAACQRVNKKAAFSNAGNVEVSFEDNSPLKQAVLTPLDFVESWSHVLGQMEKDRKHKSEPNKIQITYEISHKKKKADISVKTPEGKMKLKNIDLRFLEDEENENNKVKTNPLEKNQCFLDKSDVETFDNHRYTLQLGQCWHVVMTSYPKTNSDKWNKQKNIPKNMQVTVLAKEDEKGQKKIKITLGEKEVELSPSESGQPQAKINNKPVKLSKKKSHEEKKDSKSVLELFELPDNSIKLVSDEYNLKLMYDGSRAEIEVGERYRKSIRGLCGNNDGESDNDQQTPKGCQLEKFNEFSATWALTENEECKGPARENAEKAKHSQCIRETVRFGDVISDEDADRESSSTDSDDNNEKHCTHHRTKVLKTDNEICFSLRPIPVCSSKCSPIATATRKIQYHCVPRNSASEKVAKRIESGANPDLSQKTVSKFESQEIPIRCKP